MSVIWFEAQTVLCSKHCVDILTAMIQGAMDTVAYICCICFWVLTAVVTAHQHLIVPELLPLQSVPLLTIKY